VENAGIHSAEPRGVDLAVPGCLGRGGCGGSRGKGWHGDTLLPLPGLLRLLPLRGLSGVCFWLRLERRDGREPEFSEEKQCGVGFVLSIL